MPDAVVVSASFAWTTMRSSSGLIATLVAVVTGIPSWVQVSPPSDLAGQMPHATGRGRRRGCRSAWCLTARRMANGWHPHVESANREVMPELALRQPECQCRHAGENACVTDDLTTLLRTPEGVHALALAAEVAALDPLAAAASVRARGVA